MSTNGKTLKFRAAKLKGFTVYRTETDEQFDEAYIHEMSIN